MSSLTGNNFQTGQNLENISPVSTALNGINQRITGITYDGITESTTISNNLIITDGKNLFINNYNVDARIDQLDADLNVVENSIIDIQNVNDEQNIDIDLLQSEMDTVQSDISVIENSIIDIQNVNSTQNTDIDLLQSEMDTVQSDITTLNTQITGISYTTGTDTTQIDNNVVIPVGKTLTLNGSDVDTRFTGIETKTTGITYNSGTTTTTISNPNIVLNGYINAISNSINNVSNLYINSGGAVYIGGNAINTSALLTLNNTWTGTNSFNTSLPTSTLTPTNTTDLTTKTYVDTKISSLVNSAPTTLDTLNELASALGNDPNFATTMTTLIGTKTTLSGVQANNNIWTGTNSFNTSLPTSTLTPTNTTDLTTKTYVDSQVGTKTTLSGVQANNNIWTGTNDFTANDCTVALQLANTDSSQAASTAFVQQQFDYFLSHNNIYTGETMTQNFTNTNITVPTQSNSDTSQKASNSAYVINKIEQFRTSNQTLTGTITFSSQPYISSSIPVLDRGTAITTTGAVARDVGIDPVGYRTYFDDFYNQGIYFGQERDNDVFTCRDANIQYQVNTNGQVSYIPYFQSVNSQTAGHPGILACYTGGAAGRYAILNWYSNLYPFNTNNLASYECMVSNASVSTTNSTFYCTVGMTDQLFNNTNGYFWYYDAGVWKALVRKAGVTIVYGTVGSGWASPLRNKWIKLRMDYFVSGANITINWYYNNFTDNESETFTTTIANISGIDLGPTFRLEAGNSTEVIMYLDFQVVKYYADRN